MMHSDLTILRDAAQSEIDGVESSIVDLTMLPALMDIPITSGPDVMGCRVGAVIHDFNNSLQAIVSVLNLLQCRISPGSIKDFDHLMDIALTSTDKAHLRVRELASCMKERASSARPTVIDDVVRSLQPLLVATIGDDIAVNLRLAAHGKKVLCEARDIENVLVNLVNNARDAMPAGGALLIETVVVPPGEERSYSFVGLQVADTGMGMSPDAIEYACRAYYSTKGPAKGSGLGLWSVKDFTDRHGGQLSIRSSEGLGTAVQILLPVA
ncbi:sensor histidine kinase [Tardiphaga sp. 839_C3_N1_4]|uniref:sensor histidine kinase n=1 Tax=Tardiphaga sp. 839_C3_N1_4 TaxID=3240761 RepID=UPI003F281928